MTPGDEAVPAETLDDPVGFAGGSCPVVWSPEYEVSIGPHVFPTAKYRLVVERLEAEGVLRRDELIPPRPASWSDLGRVHTTEYLDKVRDGTLSLEEVLRLEVPFSPELREAWMLCCGGTSQTAELALAHGVAMHLGGGFHHAFPGHGEGFCLFNDVAVAASKLLAEGKVRSVLVVDLDVHQGNGTAHIFRHEPRVFTLSFHQEDNYPLFKPPSDLDVGLPDGTGDEEYLGLLRRHLPSVVEETNPDLVLYLAGADPYREDQLGGLALTIGGLEERDRTVIATCLEAEAGVGVVLAGGYARNTEDTVEIHANTVRMARRLGADATFRTGH